jgi:hypothetical protein
MPAAEAELGPPGEAKLTARPAPKGRGQGEAGPGFFAAADRHSKTGAGKGGNPAGGVRPVLGQLGGRGGPGGWKNLGRRNESGNQQLSHSTFPQKSRARAADFIALTRQDAAGTGPGCAFRKKDDRVRKAAFALPCAARWTRSLAT